MKILTLGGSGNIGKVVCDQLIEEGHTIYVADVYQPENMEDRKISGWIKAEFEDVVFPNYALIKELSQYSQFDLAINLLPSKYADSGNLTALHSNIKLIVDTSFAKLNNEKDSLFKDVTLLRDCGIAPGISNLIAAKAYFSIPKHEKKNSEIHIHVGGNAQDCFAPLHGYAATWSIQDILEEYSRPATIIAGGQKIEIPACSGYQIEILESVPCYESFITDGLRSLADYFKDIGFATERTIRRVGHLDHLASLNELELANELKWSKTEPDQLDMYIWKYCKNLEYGNTEAKLLTIYSDDNYTAMAKATGYSCCAFVNTVINFKLSKLGVIYPEDLAGDDQYYTFIFDYLSMKNIKFTPFYPFF